MDDPHDSDATFVEVMALDDAGLLPVVRSLLEESGIRFYIRNEQTQNLFGFGQTGVGHNLITGPPIVMVEDSRLDEARELLTPLATPLEAGEDVEGPGTV